MTPRSRPRWTCPRSPPARSPFLTVRPRSSGRTIQGCPPRHHPRLRLPATAATTSPTGSDPASHRGRLRPPVYPAGIHHPLRGNPAPEPAWGSPALPRRRTAMTGPALASGTVPVGPMLAVFATELGTEQEQRLFVSLLRDLVARGRNVAMPVIAATQRPSVDIIPKSLRDLFGYRAAFRCTSTGSSDIILGDGWSSAGMSATDIAPTNPGECQLIAEGGVPERVKVSYLTDADITALADYAAWTRRTGSLPTAGPATAVA